MPIRLVREGINSSPRINSLSRGAELFYRRLMSVVDDYGRFHASPATLRGACWPTCPDHVEEAEVKQWLEECLQVHSKCLATDKQWAPLVILYENDGCKYLQLTDFRQQTRSHSKFPEPAKHLLSNAEQVLLPRRETETETETIFEDEDERRVSNKNGNREWPYLEDETYSSFVVAACSFWEDLIEEDLQKSWQFTWKKFSFEQKLSVVEKLTARIASGENSQFVTRPPKYLEDGDWKRPPRKAESKNGNSRSNGTEAPYKRPANLIDKAEYERLKAEREKRIAQ